MSRAAEILRMLEQEMDVQKKRETLNKQILDLQSKLRDADKTEEQEKLKTKIAELSFEFNKLSS